MKITILSCIQEDKDNACNCMIDSLLQYGTTPLIWAARKGFTEIVEMLLADGANVDNTGMVSTQTRIYSV